jgi:hypothetical protein
MWDKHTSKKQLNQARDRIKQPRECSQAVQRSKINSKENKSKQIAKSKSSNQSGMQAMLK